jgi:hypothetical protein
MVRPDFLDNRPGNTLAAGLGAYIRDEVATRREPPAVWIATGYFRPDGFPLIAEELEQASCVRLLLGTEPLPRPPRERMVGETPEHYEAALIDESLRALQDGLAHDRDLLGFTIEADRQLQRLIDFLHRGNVEVRLYRRRFLHGKAFLLPGDGVIVGSSNFTPGGLVANLELNLGRYDPEPVGKVTQWFEDLWTEADPFDLAAIYEARFEPYDPYLIYLRVLWELYGQEQEEQAKEGIGLADFQRDGLIRARRIMREYSGALVADGVGLGKTYIGGELLRATIYDQRQRALLIAPAALRDGTWDTFFTHHNIRCEALSYEELAREGQLGGNGGTYLHFAPEEYSLVVIDEAQAFRNPGTRRAEALRRLLAGDPPKQVVMLSATPVNNSLWDLYYLLSYFVKHDAAFSGRGILSLQKRFTEAAAEDPFELKPDVLFDVLDEITVRRSRHFVRKWYPNASIRNSRGELVPIRFPKPTVLRVDYDFGGVLPGIFDELEEALMPEEGLPRLTMARYSPSRYRLAPDHEAEPVADPEALAEPYERQLVGLLRSALLKRFESSVYAFGRTCQKLADSHDSFLWALDKGYVARAEVLAELEDVDSDEAFEELMREYGQDEAAGYETDALRTDVGDDRELLLHFAEAASGVRDDDDPKLQALTEELTKIVRQAEKDGLDEEDRRNRRKVLIFSYYADTVQWIEDHLREAVGNQKALACYRDRIASVTSDDSRGGVSRADAIYGFAPVSTEAPAGKQDDRFDILICTDVLAEGMNLQQCRHVVNYDLPWNPMRIVQRNGRIDRIGSHYDRVFARCVFPDERLNDLLDLEDRLRRKVAQAAATVGVESAPIPGAVTGEQVFADTREEIERLLEGDPTLLETAGEDPSAHSGEEYRQELGRGMERFGQQVRHLPWAAGSGYVAEGKQRGWAFCARVGDRPFLRFVAADAGDVQRDTLLCLKQFTCEESTERHLPEDLRQGVYTAWDRARQDILDEWALATDPANLQPKVPKLCREMAEHLLKYPPAGMSAAEIDEVRDCLSAPYPARVQNAFRPLFTPDAEDCDPYEVSRAIVAQVKELGLQPYEAPEPLPPIDSDQVSLICWMGVSAPGS